MPSSVALSDESQYFLCGITAEIKEKIFRIGVDITSSEFPEMEIDGNMGRIFGKSIIKRILDIPGIRSAMSETQYRGITSVFLASGDAEQLREKYSIKSCCWVPVANGQLYFDAIAEVLLPVVQKNIKVHGGGGSQEAPNSDTSRFQINMFCGHPSAILYASLPKELFGITNHSRDKSIYSASGRSDGIVIKDDAGNEVAELFEHTLYILFRVQTRSKSALKIFRKILEATARVMPEFLEDRRAKKVHEVSILDWNGELPGDYFKDLVRTILSPVVKKEISISVPHGILKPPINDDGFYIWIWSHPYKGRSEGQRPPPIMWGIPVDCLDAGFLPSNKGIAIGCPEDGWTVAELIHGNNLYIFHDAVHKDTASSKEILKKILEECILEIQYTPEERVKRFKERHVEYMKEMKRKYVGACAGRLEKNVAATQKKILDNRKELADFQKSIVIKIREILGSEEKLVSISASLARSQEIYEREFEKLLSIDKILSLEIRAGKILVFTDTLYCRNPDTKKLHEIGKFRIEIYMDGSENGVLWFNLTRKVIAYRGEKMYAPHVFLNGKACLGNTALIFPELIAKSEYAACALLAIGFIESVNTKDQAGAFIVNWPVVDESAISSDVKVEIPKEVTA